MGRLNTGNGMAQANVAREPSMEEILASIRKIIESNDTADVESQTPEEGPEVGAGEALSDRSEASWKSELETRRSLLASAPEPAPAVEPEPPQPKDTPDVSTPPSAAQIVSESTAAEPEPAAPEAESPAETHALPMSETVADASSIPTSTIADTAASRIGQGLISEETERQVARSFETLDYAVKNGPSRSFDEIAQDMLRPILRQWMDDNLPGLVEQLVREEIERVVQRR